jgi:hypothetical protein
MRRNTRFREVEHPRGHDGKFIEKGGASQEFTPIGWKRSGWKVDTSGPDGGQAGVAYAARHRTAAFAKAGAVGGAVYGTGLGGPVGGLLGAAGGAAYGASVAQVAHGVDRARLKRHNRRSNSVHALRG